MTQSDFYFHSSLISDELFHRIVNISFRNAPRSLRDKLRYVRFPHHATTNRVCIGEMIINEKIEMDVQTAFKIFFEKNYIIEHVQLIEDFGGDDNRSMRANNTSCFNYRMISSSSVLSNHALGLAIDINPLYNPYVRGNVVDPIESLPYVNRNLHHPMFISSNDLAYEVFVRQLHWEWGGDWYDKFGYVDYQHFSKIFKTT